MKKSANMIFAGFFCRAKVLCKNKFWAYTLQMTGAAFLPGKKMRHTSGSGFGMIFPKYLCSISQLLFKYIHGYIKTTFIY